MAFKLNIYSYGFIILLFIGLISCKNVNPNPTVDSKESGLEVVGNQEQEVVFPPFDPDIVNGRWEAQDTSGYEFSLMLISDADTLSGQYCAINARATRIDCGLEGESASCYIKGEIKGNQEYVLLDIVSCRSLKSGKAQVYILEDGSIDWKLITPPGSFGVDHLAPQEANLIRVSSEY